MKQLSEINRRSKGLIVKYYTMQHDFFTLQHQKIKPAACLSFQIQPLKVIWKFSDHFLMVCVCIFVQVVCKKQSFLHFPTVQTHSGVYLYARISEACFLSLTAFLGWSRLTDQTNFTFTTTTHCCTQHENTHWCDTLKEKKKPSGARRRDSEQTEICLKNPQ